MSGHWSEILRKAGACEAAVAFASRFDTLQEAWDECVEPSWLFWLLAKIDPAATIPDEKLAQIRWLYRDINCYACRDSLLGNTWATVFENFDGHDHADADAVRRVFPCPPRFRNGAGE